MTTSKPIKYYDIKVVTYSFTEVLFSKFNAEINMERKMFDIRIQGALYAIIKYLYEMKQTNTFLDKFTFFSRRFGMIQLA